MKQKFQLFAATFSSALLLASAAEAQCGALQFDGTDDIATVLDGFDDFNFASAMTVEAWYRVDVALPGAGLVSGTNDFGFHAFKLGARSSESTTGSYSVSVPNTDGVSALNATGPGGWKHMAGTYDGVTLTIYVDGAFAASKLHGTSGSVSNISELVFGRGPIPSQNQFFNGSLDEVRVWNVVRTPAEILASYNVELAGNETGLVGYFQFNEGSGDVIVDSSPRGNHGFLGGAPGPGSDDPARVYSGVTFACNTLGLAYCFGDGSGTACPCGNPGGADGGCANGTFASGGRLDAFGSASIAAGNLVLSGTRLPINQPGLYFQGNNATSGGAGALFGDGLRCAGTNVIRLQVRTANGTGDSATTVDIGATGGVGAGQVKRYQLWYRDPAGSPCGSVFNLSNGVEIAWTL